MFSLQLIALFTETRLSRLRIFYLTIIAKINIKSIEEEMEL
jgi:hypothetical protein